MATWNQTKYGIFVLLSSASTKFHKNIEILRKQTNSATWLKLPCSMENCGP